MIFGSERQSLMWRMNRFLVSCGGLQTNGRHSEPKVELKSVVFLILEDLSESTGCIDCGL